MGDTAVGYVHSHMHHFFASLTGMAAEQTKETAKVEEFVPSHMDAWSDEKKAQYQIYLDDQPLSSKIQSGDNAIIETGRGRVFQLVKKGIDFKVRKVRVSASLLLDQHYGVTYEVEKKALKRKARAAPDQLDVEGDFIPTANNSKLYDNNDKAQALTSYMIEELKKEKTSDELIETIISNSATFEKKTEFSQAKYKKRKKAKYSNDITILRPTMTDVCKIMLEKHPKKTLFMRPDTLAYMMTAANVNSGGTTLVFESCTGLVLAAAAERHGGFGRIFNVHPGFHPNKDAVGKLGLRPSVIKAITHCPMYLLNSALRVNCDATTTTTTAPTTTTPTTTTNSPTSDETPDPSSISMEPSEEGSDSPKNPTKTARLLAENREAWEKAGRGVGTRARYCTARPVQERKTTAQT